MQRKMVRVVTAIRSRGSSVQRSVRAPAFPMIGRMELVAVHVGAFLEPLQGAGSQWASIYDK